MSEPMSEERLTEFENLDLTIPDDVQCYVFNVMKSELVDEVRRLRAELSKFKKLHTQFVSDMGTTFFACTTCGHAMNSRDGCLHCRLQTAEECLRQACEAATNAEAELAKLKTPISLRTLPTVDEYEYAIEQLKLGMSQLAPDGKNCAICEDSGHQAFECHHNPLIAMKLMRGYRCYHCGDMFLNPSEAREHFGSKDDDAQCVEQIKEENTRLKTELATLKISKVHPTGNKPLPREEVFCPECSRAAGTERIVYHAPPVCGKKEGE